MEETTNRRARVVSDRRERRGRRPCAAGPESWLGLHAQREEGSGPRGREARELEVLGLGLAEGEVGVARPCWLPGRGKEKRPAGQIPRKESFFLFLLFQGLFKSFQKHLKSF